MFFDTHSHLNLPQFEADLPSVVERARQNKVSDILVVGIDPASNRKAVRIASEYKLWAALGLHPSDIETDNPALPGIKELSPNDRVVAVGEIGLDYTCAVDHSRQITAFRSFLETAKNLGFPVIIHSRDAAEDTLSVLRQAGPTKGVWHCFSGDVKLAEEVLDLGLFVSFTANITYRKNEALRQAVVAVPLERLLLETDCPFMPPEGRRGQRNEPANIPLLAKAIADIKQTDIAEVAEKTYNNSCGLFLKSGTGT
ncbi:MAG: TatD family hydrolase [Candidatus Ratteibacteria bacterium]|jgi:TatD DNase family protein